MDEAWDSTTAYTFQTDLTFRNLTLVSASRGNQDIHFLQPRILSNIFTAPFFLFFGVGSVQGRLASILAGALGIVGFYLLSRKIGGIVFSSCCTLLLISDNLFFVVSKTIRPEIFVVTISIWVLLFVLNAGADFWKLLFSGVLLGVSLYAHPNAFLVLVAILIIILTTYNVRQLWKILILIALGMAIGFLPYAVYVGVQDGANQFHDFWLQIHDRAGVITNPGNFLADSVVSELERYASYIYFPYRLPIFLIQIAALGYAFYKRNEKFNQSFLLFIFVQVILFSILISAKTSRYLAVLMPVLIILVVKMLWGIANWSYHNTFREILSSAKQLHRSILLSTFLGMILVFNQIGGDFWSVWQSRDCSFSTFISQVRDLVPPSKKVWGPMTYWFGFYDFPYRTEWTINNSEEMNKFQPDYVILYDNSEIWGNTTGVTKRLDPNYKMMEPVRNMLIQLVTERGTRVGSVPNSCYGDIEIFKLQWK